MRRVATGLGVLAAVVAAVVWRPWSDDQPAHTAPPGDTAFAAGEVSLGEAAEASPQSGTADRPTPVVAPDAAVLRFEAWAARYLAETDPAARAAMLAEGRAAAAARRDYLYDLIARDPEQALRHAVSWSTRQGLPEEIVALLENRVGGVGAFHALAALPASGTVAAEFRATRREATLDGATYEAHVYGRRLALGSRERLAMHGIVLDDRLALLDSPVRALEPGEPLPAGRTVVQTCAVSGLATAPGATTAPPAPIAADLGDRIVYLCSAGHIAVLGAQLQAGEEGAGGDAALGATPGLPAPLDVVGTRRVVMIRIRFADQPAWFEPESAPAAAAMLAAADAFFRENSAGALRVEGDVSPVYVLPQTAAWYAAHDASGYGLNVLEAARAVAASPAAHPGNEHLPATNHLAWDLDMIRYTTGPGAFSGQAYVGMRGCWLKTSDPAVLIHELGHNFGLWHANAWRPHDPLAPLGDGINAEYGDAFDTMGPARGGAWHFNTWHKARLGWLPQALVATTTQGGVFTLAAHDLGTWREGAAHALRIPRDHDRDYWLELRRHPGWLAARPGAHEGLTVRWDPWLRSNGGTQLIDTTPASDGGVEDGVLAFGRTFSDAAAGIHVTPLGPGATPDTVEVEVRVGDFAGNQRPIVGLSAYDLTPAVGTPVTFTAFASDPDGDALSYAWEIGDAAASGPRVTRTFTTPGDHRVRVTVTDRRGGTASASLVVRAGAGSAGSRISGRIVDLDGAPVPDVLVTNGLGPGVDLYRSAWSDSDGTFTLLDVPAGTWHVQASAPGWLFAPEEFSRPVTVPDGGTPSVRILGVKTGFTVAGMARRADGTPVPGALVRIGDHVEPTDASGEFSVNGLEPGRHVISIEAPGAVFASTEVEVGLADVHALYLTEETFTVGGTIEGAAGSYVTVTNGWQTAFVPVPSVEPGARFELAGVPAGTWAFRAVAPARTFSPVGGDSRVHVGADRDDLTLAADVEPRHAVAGVVFDRGLGVAGAIVRAGGVSTTTDARGHFWLPGLAAGMHTVTASAAGLTLAPEEYVVDLTTGSMHGLDFHGDRANLAPAFAAPPQARGPLNRPFVALLAEGTDDEDAGLLRYWWSVAGPAPGEVSFSANGSQRARATIARFAVPGDYHLRVTAVDRHGAAKSEDIHVRLQSDSAPPAIIEPARAEPAVIGASLETTLSVRASSPAGEAGLTYTWRADPAAPGPVQFSSNGTAGARVVTARFQRPGDYLLRVAVRDAEGRMVESAVAVHVLLTYGSWLSTHFSATALADPAARDTQWGELADPDGDGLVNLLEYAFALDPLAAGVEGRPHTHFVVDSGREYLAVTFRPNPGAHDLVFEPQVSSDLEAWQGGLIFVPGDDPEVLTYRDPLPADAHARRFIRVDVSKQP